MLESYTIRPPKWPFCGQCAEVERVAVSTRPRSNAKCLTASLHACYIPIRGNSIFRFVPRKSAVFDPTIGRWQSKDPKSFDAGDTNLYRFVGNHPSYATDPSGLWEEPPLINPIKDTHGKTHRYQITPQGDRREDNRILDEKAGKNTKGFSRGANQVWHHESFDKKTGTFTMTLVCGSRFAP